MEVEEGGKDEKGRGRWDEKDKWRGKHCKEKAT